LQESFLKNIYIYIGVTKTVKFLLKKKGPIVQNDKNKGLTTAIKRNNYNKIDLF